MAERSWWIRWGAKSLKFMYWFFVITAMMFGVTTLLGWVMMWRLPSIAARGNVDTFFVALRALEWGTDHPADPFYLAGAGEPIQKGMIAIRDNDDPLLPSSITVESWQVEPIEKFRYHHTIRASASTRLELTTTTPHMIVPEADLQRADALVRETYFVEDELPSDLNDWGAGLFRLHWARVNSESTVKPEMMPSPSDGTPIERTWLIWQILSAGQPTADRDLPRLAELLEEAYPDPANRDEAMRWAEELYGRLRESHRVYHAVGKDFTGSNPKRIPHVLPPDNPTTLVWLLYQHVGLNESSRQVVLERYQRLFPPEKREMVRAFGAQLRKQRILAGEPLPAGGEVVDYLCVIERYLGRDAYGEKCRQLLLAEYPAKWLEMLSYAMRAGYPNDDIFIVAGSGDSMELFASSNDITMTIALILLILWGLRLIVFKLLAEWILGLREQPIFQTYRTGRGHRDIIGLIVAFGLVPVLAWVIAISTLPSTIELLIPSSGQLFLGVFLSVILGGTLILTLTRLIAVLLIRVGIDVNRVWWDEIIGLTLGAIILWHFGNGPLTIIAFIAFDLAPGIVGHYRQRSHG